MAQLTQKAIVDAFTELLNERPFDRITVTDITSRCGISRNTFYYHYSGIYDLIDAMFRAEVDRTLGTPHDYQGWLDGFVEGTRFALENRTAVYHLYKSIDHRRLERYLYDIALAATTRLVDQVSAGKPVEEGDKKDLATFIAAAITGTIIEWLERDMRDDPSVFMANVARMFEGTLESVIDNACKTPRVTQAPDA